MPATAELANSREGDATFAPARTPSRPATNAPAPRMRADDAEQRRKARMAAAAPAINAATASPPNQAAAGSVIVTGKGGISGREKPDTAQSATLIGVMARNATRARAGTATLGLKDHRWSDCGVIVSGACAVPIA